MKEVWEYLTKKKQKTIPSKDRGPGRVQSSRSYREVPHCLTLFSLTCQLESVSLMKSVEDSCELLAMFWFTKKNLVVKIIFANIRRVSSFTEVYFFRIQFCERIFQIWFAIIETHIAIEKAHSDYSPFQFLSTNEKDEKNRNNLKVESWKHLTFIIVNRVQMLQYLQDKFKFVWNHNCLIILWSVGFFFIVS